MATDGQNPVAATLSRIEHLRGVERLPEARSCKNQQGGNLKQKLYKGHKLSPEEIKEIKKDRRADAAADILILGLALIAAAIVAAFIVEIVL